MNSKYIFNTGPEAVHHKELISFLQNKKNENPNFKVLDIGGACCGRFWKYTDFILDWNEPKCCVDHNNNPYTKYGIEFIKGNLNKPSGWNLIIDYINKNGKFDFVLCTHTIEDLQDPTFVMEIMPQVSKAGYISVPSKESEIRRGYHATNPNFMGCGHHFWIYVNYKNKLIAIPKLNWIEHFTNQDLYNVNPNLGGSGNPNILFPKQELNLYWENELDFCLLFPVGFDSLPDFFQKQNPDVHEIYKEKKHPWEVAKYLLNHSD